MDGCCEEKNICCAVVFYINDLFCKKKFLEASAKFGPGDILGYVGNTGHCKSDGLDMDGINESPAEKKARADGKGAHLHLQLHIGDWQNDRDFFKSVFGTYNPRKETGLASRLVSLYNPFDYDDEYFNN